MSDQENTIRNLEIQFPAMSGVTFTQASHRMLEAGQSVLQTDEGVIYEYFPDGTRQHVKDIEPPTPVIPGQKIDIR
jgi:hypothetical protein